MIILRFHHRDILVQGPLSEFVYLLFNKTIFNLYAYALILFFKVETWICVYLAKIVGIKRPINLIRNKINYSELDISNENFILKINRNCLRDDQVLDQICNELRKLNEKSEHDSTVLMKTQNLKFAAIVIDRFCLFFVTSATALSFLFIILI